MNICERLLSDYNLGRLYNSYIIETDDAAYALSEISKFLTKSIFDKENLLDIESNNLVDGPGHLNNFPDFFMVRKEDARAKNISIEQIHELQKFLNNSSVISGFKVGLIYEAELMTEKAENACLKMLEDTPENSFIALISTNANSIFPTIKSRCAKISFKSQLNSSIDINQEHIEVFKRGIPAKDKIDFIQKFLDKDRKKWLDFAQDSQKLIVKYLKYILSPKDYDLSDLELEIFTHLGSQDAEYFENKYEQINRLMDQTTRLDLDLRVSSIKIIDLISHSSRL